MKGGNTFMADTEKEQPIYDEKVNYILTALKNGKSREEIADDLNYSSYKSMDMYIRRKNFLWDADRGTYVPKVDDPGFENKKLTGISSKSDLIISLFADDGSDPKTVAKKVGFNDHKDLADFMKRQNYIWSSDERNYIHQSEMEDDEEEKKKAAPETNGKELAAEIRKQVERQVNVAERLAKFTPVMEFLEENMDSLRELLAATEDGEDSGGEIPHFAVPGTTKTKSVYMADRLAELVTEFSKVRNVSQRDIFEAAVIEYLRKYGYRDAVDSLLR
jgi:hypothetical protein